MSPELLAYPFLFLGLFFEVFVLVSLLSEPARSARSRSKNGQTPHVAVIVPCFNEAGTVGGTCESLLALDYPADKLDIILVDDGSTDETPAAMAKFAHRPNVKIIRQENGGKYRAINEGMRHTTAELVGCLDADSFVEPDALHEVIASFDRPEVAAVTSAMSIHQPHNVLEHMQNAEYIFGIAMRHAMATVNGLYVTPGPFSFYRRDVVLELGGFRHGHQTEDLEMALRIQRAGHVIENAPRARVFTKAPRTVRKLIKQRVRWTSGFLRNIISSEYRGLIGNKKHGTLGLLILPTALIAIVSGLALFVLGVTEFVISIVHTIAIAQGVPLSYTLFPHLTHFDWFYIPATAYALLGSMALFMSLALVFVGKRISQTRGPIAVGLISYVLIYGILAPLWLLRSVSDVTLGKRRSWR